MENKKNYNVYLQAVPAIATRSKRMSSTNFPADIRPLYQTIMQEMQENNILCAGAPLIIYHDEEFNPQQVDFEAAIPVTDMNFANSSYPACQAAVCTHVGSYDQLPEAYQSVFAWINNNGYRAAGPIREDYPNDPANTPPGELVTHIIVPVANK